MDYGKLRVKTWHRVKTYLGKLENMAVIENKWLTKT